PPGPSTLSLHDALPILLDAWATPPIPHRVAWYQWRQNWKQAPNGSRLRSFWRIARWLLGQEKYRVWSFFNLLRLDPEELTAVLEDRKSTRLNSSHLVIS